MNKFQETMKQIAALKKIKNIAWHIFEREESQNKVMIRVEDETGEVLEILLHDPHLHGVLYGRDTLIVLFLLMRLYQENDIDINDHWLGVYMNLPKEVNRARKILPYKGVNWINEERARLYDYVQPEIII